jgi:hypothetical protein
MFALIEKDEGDNTQKMPVTNRIPCLNVVFSHFLSFKQQID